MSAISPCPEPCALAQEPEAGKDFLKGAGAAEWRQRPCLVRGGSRSVR